jgi:hypothetical protein
MPFHSHIAEIAPNADKTAVVAGFAAVAAVVAAMFRRLGLTRR